MFFFSKSERTSWSLTPQLDTVIIEVSSVNRHHAKKTLNIICYWGSWVFNWYQAFGSLFPHPFSAFYCSKECSGCFPCETSDIVDCPAAFKWQLYKWYLSGILIKYLHVCTKYLLTSRCEKSWEWFHGIKSSRMYFRKHLLRLERSSSLSPLSSFARCHPKTASTYSDSAV